MGTLDILGIDNSSVGNTLALILLVFIARFVAVRIIKSGTPTLSDMRRRWLSVVQNSSLLLGLLGLIYIWAPQLSTFALSLTAFAVAMVIATKEYLLCIVGGLYRATSSAFSVGDWIQVQNHRGEVLTEGILSTRLQELDGRGPYEFSGRIIVVPNSVFLSHTVFNESFQKKYRYHAFTVTTEAGIDPKPMLDAVRERLVTLCPMDDTEADRHWQKMKARLQTELPSRKPDVSVHTTDIGKIAFQISLFCATARAVQIEGDVSELLLSQAAAAMATQ